MRGRLGLRSGLRTFRDLLAEGGAARVPFVQLRFGRLVTDWTPSGDVYEATIDQALSGARLDVAAVKAQGDTRTLIRAESVDTMEAGTYHYDPAVSATLSVWLWDSAEPGLVMVALGIWVSTKGNELPAVGPNLLTNGDLRDWTGNDAASWAEVGITKSGEVPTPRLPYSAQLAVGSSLLQTVGLTPGARYRLTGWHQGEGLLSAVRFAGSYIAADGRGIEREGLPGGMVLYLPFNVDADGFDQSGHGNDFTMTGDVPPVIVNGALRLDASQHQYGFRTNPPDLSFGNEDFSVSMRVWQSAADIPNEVGIFGKGTTVKNWGLTTTLGKVGLPPGGFCFHMKHSGGLHLADVEPAEGLVADREYRIYFEYDFAAKLMKIRLRDAFGMDYTVTTPALTGPPASSEDAWLGHSTAFSAYYFNGRVRDIRVLARKQTAQEQEIALGRALAPTGEEWRRVEYEFVAVVDCGPKLYTIEPGQTLFGDPSRAISGTFTFDPCTLQFSEPFSITCVETFDAPDDIGDSIESHVGSINFSLNYLSPGVFYASVSGETPLSGPITATHG